MAKTNPESIIQRGQPIFKEHQSVGEIFPGHLLGFVLVDGVLKVRKQNVAEVNCRRAFALENDLLGRGIETAYVGGTLIRYGVFHSGQEVYARIAAGAPAIKEGDALECSDDGTLQKQTTGETIAYALQGVDNSSGLTETFIIMELT